MAYEDNVFINSPFDSDYQPLFSVIVFAIHDCGFVARCALEIDDGGEPRIDKICRIIRECKFGIHDISRTELDPVNGLPRFNMPLELGLFLGAGRFGPGRQKEKRCLILDRDQYRYHIYCSDISGQDISPHNGDARQAITVVRNWLRVWTTTPGVRMPSGGRMYDRYQDFLAALPAMCNSADLDPEELIFLDYQKLVVGWLTENS